MTSSRMHMENLSNVLRPSKTLLFMIFNIYFYGNGGCPKIDGREYREK